MVRRSKKKKAEPNPDDNTVCFVTGIYNGRRCTKKVTMIDNGEWPVKPRKMVVEEVKDEE